MYYPKKSPGLSWLVMAGSLGSSLGLVSTMLPDLMMYMELACSPALQILVPWTKCWVMAMEAIWSFCTDVRYTKLV